MHDAVTNELYHMGVSYDCDNTTSRVISQLKKRRKEKIEEKKLAEAKVYVLKVRNDSFTRRAIMQAIAQ